jgi:hypothetical protein
MSYVASGDGRRGKDMTGSPQKVDWRKRLSLVPFILVMAGVVAIAKWGIGTAGWWFLIPWVTGFLLIAWMIERHAKAKPELEKAPRL